MKIEVWSDVACPFCYIGKQNLEKALKQFAFKDEVKVEYKSFELDPSAPVYNGQSFYEKLLSKFGDAEQTKQFLENLTQSAKKVGLTFNLEGLKPTNTFDSHRLTKWAKTKGKEADILENLLNAHFTDSKDVGDHETLADLAEASGLDRQEALKVLNDKSLYADEVRSDQIEAKRYGISGVPFLIINQKYAVSGAQPAEAFLEALNKVWEEENPLLKLKNISVNNEDDTLCTDGSCGIPPRKK
ncbi:MULTISPECIES: DsbA family oxidoreductase [Bacillus]|uniref:DsbA family oxidoreductase n=1 Tax=Bacillus TaxID=1386 RepID=UPI0003B06942|nr:MULTISPECIES: DsbA family oxidoreductase [Bacillus]AIU83221.1 DSBA-like thioredoxin domain protein [Bacillus velezensis]ASK59786.1 DsbA family oxidoreductase [Bacillus velezensis]ATD74420.1 hypothetical protein CLI98_01113 [Bacillus velezensis]ATV24150.1 DsbA family oxidoreductase [Bacillus sp. Lzh-5]KAF1276391.1 disulfide bond formation protein DsbA [Bacillus amyloliquefaciens]